MLKSSAPQKRIRRGSCCFAVAVVAVLDHLGLMWICCRWRENIGLKEREVRRGGIFQFIIILGVLFWRGGEEVRLDGRDCEALIGCEGFGRWI